MYFITLVFNKKQHVVRRHHEVHVHGIMQTNLAEKIRKTPREISGEPLLEAKFWILTVLEKWGNYQENIHDGVILQLLLQAATVVCKKHIVKSCFFSAILFISSRSRVFNIFKTVIS